MQKLLIADDNSGISSVLAEYARKEGYEPIVASDGGQAYRLFQESTPDMVLLDVMMPVMDGFEVCRRIRSESNVPVIMITARGEDFEKIMGLDIGADDYIVKPFSPGEVMARVRAILRRLTPNEQSNNSQVVSFDNLTVNLDDYIVTVGDHPIALTKKEIEILWTLTSHPGRVYSRDQLLNSLWGYDYFGDNRTVDSHIKRLRAKLDEVPHDAWDIRTIWGVGYKFEGMKDEK